MGACRPSSTCSVPADDLALLICKLESPSTSSAANFLADMHALQVCQYVQMHGKPQCNLQPAHLAAQHTQALVPSKSNTSEGVFNVPSMWLRPLDLQCIPCAFDVCVLQHWIQQPYSCGVAASPTILSRTPHSFPSTLASVAAPRSNNSFGTPACPSNTRRHVAAACFAGKSFGSTMRPGSGWYGRCSKRHCRSASAALRRTSSGLDASLWMPARATPAPSSASGPRASGASATLATTWHTRTHSVDWPEARR
eukprot:361885-Chlamydomonas_euryale.AAC.7